MLNMINMIKLDWLGMKSYHIWAFLTPLPVILIGLTIGEWMVIPVSIFLMWTFALVPFLLEEKGDINRLYLTLPVQRKRIVSARFGLALLMVTVGILLGIVLTLVINALVDGQTTFNNRWFQLSFGSIFLLVCVGLSLCSLVLFCSFPFLFKFGYAKGKFFAYYVPIVGAGVLIGILSLLPIYTETFFAVLSSAFDWIAANNVWFALIILAVAALFFALSYLLSQKAYAKREF